MTQASFKEKIDTTTLCIIYFKKDLKLICFYLVFMDIINFYFSTEKSKKRLADSEKK